MSLEMYKGICPTVETLPQFFTNVKTSFLKGERASRIASLMAATGVIQGSRIQTFKVIKVNVFFS